MTALEVVQTDLATACRDLVSAEQHENAARAFVAYIQRAKNALDTAEIVAGAASTPFVQVVDTDSCREAKERLLSLKNAAKAVEETLHPVTTELHAAWQTLCARKRQYTESLESAMSEQAGEIRRYDDALLMRPMWDETETVEVPKVEGLSERNSSWKTDLGSTPQERRWSFKQFIALAAGVEVEKVDDGLVDYGDWHEKNVKSFVRRSGEDAMLVLPMIHVYREKVIVRARSNKKEGEVQAGNNDIPLVAVDSSQIKGIGYDSDTLRIQFSSGSTYDYHGVPYATFAKLCEAESKGKFFGAHIKGQYTGKKVE